MGRGEILNQKNIVPKRPGLGISPLNVNKIYGKRASRNLNEDSLIKWKDFE